MMNWFLFCDRHLPYLAEILGKVFTFSANVSFFDAYLNSLLYFDDRKGYMKIKRVPFSVLLEIDTLYCSILFLAV